MLLKNDSLDDNILYVYYLQPPPPPKKKEKKRAKRKKKKMSEGKGAKIAVYIAVSTSDRGGGGLHV